MTNKFLSKVAPCVLPLLGLAGACQKSLPAGDRPSHLLLRGEASLNAGAEGPQGLFLADASTGTSGAQSTNSGAAPANRAGQGSGAATSPSGNGPVADGGTIATDGGTTKPDQGALGSNLNPLPGNGGATPLVLDWDRDGRITTSVAVGRGYVPFDIAAKGERISLEWVAPTEAFLCLDLNENGQIDDGRELFGNATQVRDRKGVNTTAKHGFLALAQHDANHNGLIDHMDPVFAKLLLWRDKNHNGISEIAELTKLSETDVLSISLAYRDLSTGLGLLPKSLSFVGQASMYTTRSGLSFEIADVYFAAQKSWTFAQTLESNSASQAKSGDNQ